MYILYKWSTDMEICNKIQYSIKGLYDAKQQMSSRENKHKHKIEKLNKPNIFQRFN